MERVYNAPVERVWSAITDKDQMKQWYFDSPDAKKLLATTPTDNIPSIKVLLNCGFMEEPGTSGLRHFCAVRPEQK